MIAYFPREAYCYPQLYVAHLLAKAAEFGVEVRSGARARVFDAQSDDAGVRLDDGTVIACDQVVSCVGRWTEALLAESGVTVPMAKFERAGDVTVGYLAVTNPLPVMLTRVLTTSQLNVRPEGGGRLMLQALDLDSTADPQAVPSTDSLVASEMLDRLASVLRNTGNASLTQLYVGQRAIPADGLTIAGPLPSGTVALRRRHAQRDHARTAIGRPRGVRDSHVVATRIAVGVPARPATRRRDRPDTVAGEKTGPAVVSCLFRTIPSRVR